MINMTMTALTNKNSDTLIINCRYHYADPSVGQVFSGVLRELSPNKAYVHVETLELNTLAVCKPEQLFAEKEDALRALYEYNDSKVAELKASITSVNDLVVFLLDYPCAPGGETDWNARRAAMERAHELLGIPMEHLK